MTDHAWLYDLVDPDDQVRGRALEHQRARVAEGRGIGEPIAAFLGSYLVADMRFARFALLFLRWEACYPSDWRAPESNLYSPWSMKEQVLRKFGKFGVPDALRSEAESLVLAAIHRPYRCKDWHYARLVRHLPTSALSELVCDPDPLVAARAQFLLHVADHPGGPLNRNSWQRWLDNRTDVR